MTTSHCWPYFLIFPFGSIPDLDDLYFNRTVFLGFMPNRKVYIYIYLNVSFQISSHLKPKKLCSDKKKHGWHPGLASMRLLGQILNVKRHIFIYKYESRTKLLTTCSGHGQSGWSHMVGGLLPLNTFVGKTYVKLLIC